MSYYVQVMDEIQYIVTQLHIINIIIIFTKTYISSTVLVLIVQLLKIVQYFFLPPVLIQIAFEGVFASRRM